MPHRLEPCLYHTLRAKAALLHGSKLRQREALSGLSNGGSRGKILIIIC